MDFNLFYSKTEYPYPSTATSELDFVQHWVEQSVEKEILRGKQLQQLKQITPVVKEYEVVDVDYAKQPFCQPSCSQSYFHSSTKKQQKKKLKRIPKSKKGKKEESVCSCRSPNSNRKKRKAKIQNCSMRIAALAVPTKRRCLQNWINNKDILPEIMIHRLQQIIRDQRPVVKISDAIICFKTHQSKRKPKTKKCEKNDKKCIDNNLKKAKNLSDARVFCGLFAYSISQILHKPMVIELSSELEKISKVVTMDIADLLCKKQPDNKIAKNKSMLEEMSSKITIWIWSILDEANHSVLEDQLKGKIRSNNDAAIDNDLNNIKEDNIFSELEEEIGPVLDIIDDLVDSVVDICYVEPIFEDISSKSSIKVEAGQTGDAEEDETESITEIHPTDTLTDLDRLSEDITTDVLNQLYSIINNIISDDDSNKMSEHLIPLDDKLSEHSVGDKEFVDADDDSEDSFPKPDIDPNEQIENSEERDDEGNQVSDDGKKVTFSQLNTVTDTNSRDFTSSINEDDIKILNWKDSLSKIMFSVPNENLLSNADELWPSDIKYEEIVRSTVSINKSISSMARIFETEDDIPEALTEDFLNQHKINHNTSEHLHELELKQLSELNEHTKRECNKSELNELTIGETDKSELDELTKRETDKFELNELTKGETDFKLNELTKEETEKSELNEPTKGETDKSELTKGETDKSELNELTKGETDKSELNELTRGETDKSELNELTKGETDKFELNELTKGETDKSELKELTKGETDKSELNELTKSNFKLNELNILYKETIESKDVQTSIDNSHCDYNQKLRDAGINTSPSSSTTSRRREIINITSLSLADFSKKPTKTKLNYKVIYCTAPAWAMQGLYKTSDASNKLSQKNPCQIRKMCNDLLTGYNNLKLWGNWLDETSKLVAKVEQNKGKCCPNKRKQATEWMKLKKEIDDDADIWSKKYIRTRKQFAKYKDLYRDNLIPKIICKCP